MNQQDAQEFLTYILDRMHEEFLLVHNSNPSKPAQSAKENDDEGWEEVGKKNKYEKIERETERI